MRRNEKKRLMVALVALVSLALVGLVGCSQNPAAPSDSADRAILKRVVPVGKLLEGENYTEVRVSAAEGGTVQLWDVELYFPPEALSSDTLISIEIPDISQFANHFGTDGLVFNVPVRVTMSYRDADLSNVDETHISLAWFNDHTEEWDVIACRLDPFNKTVTGFVEHFSAYALITDE